MKSQTFKTTVRRSDEPSIDKAIKDLTDRGWRLVKKAKSTEASGLDVKTGWTAALEIDNRKAD